MNPASHRERVHRVFVDPDEAVGAKIRRGLEIGAEYLGLPIGYLARVDDGTQVIVASTGDHPEIQPGERCPLETAYCRRTVEADSVLAVQETASASEVSDTAVERFELGAYIGAKVIVEGDLYGTVCFSAHDPRDEGFTDAECHFVELLARHVGRAFECYAYTQALRERQAALSERREIYRAVIETSFDLVYRLDTDGQFTYLSTSVVDLLGASPRAYVGRSFSVVLPDQETTEVAIELFERVLAGETIEQQYFPLETASGARIYVDIRVTPIYDTDVAPDERTPDDIVGAQGMAHDATDRYQRQQQVQVLNRVLRHNVRNEMTVVQGYANLLRERIADEDQQLVEKVLTASQRLVQLSETARKLEDAFERPPELKPTDIPPILTSLCSQLTDRYPNVSITVNGPSTAVASTAPRIEVALWELLDNAAKHAGEAPLITVSVRSGGESVTVRIGDDGPGLPDAEREVLLTGEETSHIHGSGLGLWLVQWIVESIDGTLRIVDAADGACIEIQLPTAES